MHVRVSVRSVSIQPVGRKVARMWTRGVMPMQPVRPRHVQNHVHLDIQTVQRVPMQLQIVTVIQNHVHGPGNRANVCCQLVARMLHVIRVQSPHVRMLRIPTMPVQGMAQSNRVVRQTTKFVCQQLNLLKH